LAAAIIPAGPPPMTSADCTIGCLLGSSGTRRAAFSTPIFTMSSALNVAASLSSLCTQESWLRRFTISSR